jgi:phospho-N-acetylmuramoyl-pentapeptide-transferase
MESALIGFVVSFAVSALPGGWIIRLLQRLGARQTVSEDAPVQHAAKQGTPTMGGLLILLGLTVTTLGYAAVNPGRVEPLALLSLTLAFGAIGFLDDYLKTTRGKNLGLTSRQKLAMQIVFAAGFMVWLRLTAIPDRTTQIAFGSWLALDFGAVYYLLGVLFIAGMSNAINLADGLDGLAGGISTLLALALAAAIRGGTEAQGMWLFAGAVSGGCAGFLWYNAHPAQVFMGDTGALALGAGLAGLAMLGKAEAAAQGIFLVPYAVALSVVIQVTAFKYRRRRYGLEYAKTHRVFRRTPLHHHFEELGWKETKIVLRFWLATALCAAVTLAILRMAR